MPHDPEHANNLFRQDPLDSEVGSLSDYISKHLQKRARTEQVTETAQAHPIFSPALSPAQHTPSASSQVEQNGLVLHHLDSQLANNQLEQYLPTASTRYHMMYERLTRELKALNEELAHYRQLEGPEFQSKIEALEGRVALIRQKITELDQKIARMNPFQTVYSTIQRLSEKVSPPTSKARPAWTIIPNTKGNLRNEVFAINLELQAIQHIMEEQLHDPSFSPQQLGRLVNQYDSYLHKAERLSEELRRQQSLTHRLGTTLSGWYKTWNTALNAVASSQKDA